MDDFAPYRDDDEYLPITPTLVIPRSALQFRTSRSGGPGGQHVNKVETRVELLFNVKDAALSEEQRARIYEALASRIDDDGELHIVSERYRSQLKNREDAVARFVALLQYALRPRTPRKATRVPRSVKEARLEAKKHRGATKQQRGRVRGWED